MTGMYDFDQAPTPAPQTPSAVDDFVHAADVGGVGGPGLPGANPAPGGISGSAVGPVADLYRGLYDGDAPSPVVAYDAAPGGTATDPSGATGLPGPTNSKSTAATDAQKAAGKDLHDRQGTSDVIDDKKDKSFDPKQKIGDLSKMTEAQRLAAINKMTQNDPSDPQSGNKCGPTALLAAAMVKGGNAGVQALIDKMKSDDLAQNPGSKADDIDIPAGNPDNQAKLKALQAKLNDPKAGGLTQADLKALQTSLYDDMQKQQGKDGSNNPGTGNETMSNFINSTPEIAKLFFDKDGKQTMGLNNIDNFGDGEQGHWVLDMNTDKGGKAAQGQDGNSYNTVYDPWARKGGQVTTNAGNKTQFNDYMKTDANTDHPVTIANPNAPAPND